MRKRNLILLGIWLACVLVAYQIFAVASDSFHFQSSALEPVSSSANKPIRLDALGYPSSHRPEEALPFADLVVLAEITGIGKARWNTTDGLRPAEPEFRTLTIE